MSAEQSPAAEQHAEEAPYVQPQTPVHEPTEAPGEWLEEPEELPHRPRRRLLSPAPLALLAVLLIACGFIAGVLVEKGQSSTSSSSAAAGASSGLAARFAALRAGAAGAGGTGSASGAGTSSGGTGPAGFGGADPRGAGGATVGQVAYSSNGTLYVTTAGGNTVKVKTSAATTVSKTVTSSVNGIHPGETVTVTGSAGTNGALSAESIRVGTGASGGLGGLFGGSAAGTGTSGGAAGAAHASEPALFGSG